MLVKLFKKFFGNYNDHILKKIQKIVDYINYLESNFSKLNDDQLREKTCFFKKCLQEGKKLDDLLPEAFAVVREASKRVLNMRHFDVQLLGGIILYQNCIAEMCTGEGKTLTSTLPTYLYALTGKGVHIITMNEYLANRDAKINNILFEFLNITVGINLSGMSIESKRKNYLSDITYGTNNEFCFDYLRDNMILDVRDRVQRKLNYALIDEIDSILIDESRTPVVISGPSNNTSEIYIKINNIIPHFFNKDKIDFSISSHKKYFIIDEKSKQISLTEHGLIKVENLLITNNLINCKESLYSSDNIILMHHIITSLRAHILFKKNIDYIIKNKKIVIVDEHTGRIMIGRRWSDGLHQAIEAKENLQIFHDNQTLASITFQNYFKLYKNISGMTGTAMTEALEFRSIYNLETIVVPTNRPMIRKDLPDLIYVTEKEKINAIIKDILNCVSKKQPVLVGTVSIEKSEMISKKLYILGIKHNVLNAKFHMKEADIISKAGKLNTVTIATNIAGRGTDIVLGGSFNYKKKNKNNIKYIKLKKIWKKEHEFIISIGGLHVIGTERHESRRIDNQLCGRSGRQGDPGSSRFYLSMEDSLMRIFSSEKIKNIIRNFGVNFGHAIEHPLINKAIYYAQKKVENRNFEIRKHLLEYDDILNEQRFIIYAHRNKVINKLDIHYLINNFLKDVICKITYIYCPNNSQITTWNLKKLQNILKTDFYIEYSIINWINKKINVSNKMITDKIYKIIMFYYKKKINIIGLINMYKIEKQIMLNTLDNLWREHLSNMEYLRQGIHLRSYAQKDPKQEYKRESFIMFSGMLNALKYQVISNIMKNIIL